jgi:hypothetical protein
MRCKAPRKGPRRRPAKPVIDDEMTELAAMIAEHKLDANAENWLKLPWRDGWNAVEMAGRATADFGDLWLSDVCRNRRIGPEIYWEAQDRLSMTVTHNPMMRAALRCLQALLAKSDGGGEVYNGILLGPFSSVLPETVADLVLEYRCHDAIGVWPTLIGDKNDRLRRAFATAWSRGLYLAAYSLPPAVIPKLKVVK